MDPATPPILSKFPRGRRFREKCAIESRRLLNALGLYQLDCMITSLELTESELAAIERAQICMITSLEFIESASFFLRHFLLFSKIALRSMVGVQ